jgi:membrane-bound metal-dependent hydrolase YbcI (DUF457 family)
MGAATTAVAAHYGWIHPPTGWIGVAWWITYALAAGGFALLPDIDHDGSVAYASGGPITAVIGEGLQAVARGVYRATGGDTRRGRNGEHRGLIHSPFFAALVGFSLALGCQLTPWVGAVALAAILAPAIRSIANEMHHGNGIKIDYIARNWLGALCLAVAASATLWHFGGDGIFGWWFGAIAFIGMVTHSLGDSATNGGIPWFAPFSWKKYRLPWTFAVGSSTGKIIERWVARVCLLAGTGIVAVGIAGVL